MNVPNFFFLTALLLAIIISIKSSELKYGDKLCLIQVEYGYNITNFTFDVLNKDDAEINEFLSSRIAYLTGTDSDKDIFELYSPYINKFWLFLAKSSSVVNSLLEKDDYKKKELYINGIIIPESLNYVMPEKNNNKKIPIFIAKDNIIEKLQSYDIRSVKKHIYFLFKIKRAISSYPEAYFLILSILFIFAGFGMNILWKRRTNSLPQVHILTIQKALICIPISIILLSFVFFIKSVDIKGADPNKEYINSIYVDTALVTMEALFRTLLWFFILLLSLGWNISVQSLSDRDTKFLMKMFLIIYILMCLDQLLDSYRVKLWVFHLSEVKNILFCIGMMILLFQRINRSIRFLIKKLYYARILSLDYIDVLFYKIKILKNLYWMLGSYIVVFFLFILLHKTKLYRYDTELLELYNYTVVEIYLSAILLYLFRPRELPLNFNVDIGNDDVDDMGMVYKAYLPKYDSIDLKFLNNNRNIRPFRGKNIPILVLGPCLSHIEAEEEEVSINNYINNINIGIASEI